MRTSVLIYRGKCVSFLDCVTHVFFSGVEGISAITVDLEQFVTTAAHCDQSYRWELVDFDPVADAVNPPSQGDEAPGRGANRWVVAGSVLTMSWLLLEL